MSADMWDLDFPTPRHAPSCAIWSTHHSPCSCGKDDSRTQPRADLAPGDVERLLCIEAEVLPALRKIAEHRRRGYTHIKIGVFDRLEAVVGDSHPELTTAQRLDRLAIEPVDLPCDEEAS
jgi:hypothetical protein